MYEELKLHVPNNLPYEIESLCQFSINFDKLFKTIDYLHRYNLELFTELQNTNKRLSKVEETKFLVDQVVMKTDNFEKRISDLELSSTEMKGKEMESEIKITDLIKKFSLDEEKIINNDRMIIENGKIMRKIDNRVQENFNKINELIQLNELKEYSAEKNKKSIDEIKQYVNINIGNITKETELKSKDIENLNKGVKDIHGQIADVKLNMANTNNQIERSLTSIINTISNGNIDDNLIEIGYNLNENLNQNNGNNNILPIARRKESKDNIFKITATQLEKMRSELQTFISEFKYKEEKLNNDFISINRSIADNKKSHKELLILFKQQNETSKYYAKSDELKRLSDTINVLTNIINERPSKNDYENLKNNLKVQFQQINSKISEVKKIENKDTVKNENQNYNKTINESINSLIADLMKSEGKNIDISQNKHFVQLMKLNEKNRGDIDKSNKFFNDIQNIIYENPLKQKIEELSKKIKNLNEGFSEYKIKMSDIAKFIGYKSSEINKEAKNINDSDIIENEQGSLIEKIENINENIKDLDERIYKVEKKLSKLTDDIKNDIKNNLKLQTYKIVEQFKLKLNNFTEKFEVELRNKIDKMGLNSFENKINTKFTTDLKEKLSRNELKKNNNMFNRKIDTLENKISKTLVDTIIDLQMDDAPLLIKKTGSKLSLCASCNRPLKENFSTFSADKDYSTSIMEKTSRLTHNVTNLRKFPISNTSRK